jgi:hypothetical protein
MYMYEYVYMRKHVLQSCEYAYVSVCMYMAMVDMQPVQEAALFF